MTSAALRVCSKSLHDVEGVGGCLDWRGTCPAGFLEGAESLVGQEAAFAVVSIGRQPEIEQGFREKIRKV